MTPVLALHPWVVVGIVLASISATLLVLIVIAPWRSIRQEPPLDDEVETRILLGDDPAAIADEEHDAELDHDLDEPGVPGPAA